MVGVEVRNDVLSAYYVHEFPLRLVVKKLNKFNEILL